MTNEKLLVFTSNSIGQMFWNLYTMFWIIRHRLN